MHPIILAALLSSPASYAEQAYDQQLLLNPGCETPLVAGEIPEWTEWMGMTWTARSANPPPPPDGGSQYFSPGSSTSTWSELVQSNFLSADIRGRETTFTWSAEIWTSAEAPGNTAEIFVIARDAVSNIVLWMDTGEMSSAGSWTLVGGDFPLRPGATSIEVWLIGIRRLGEANVYFDNLSLIASFPDPIAPTSWARLKALYAR
jgi:hypothetical protein